MSGVDKQLLSPEALAYGITLCGEWAWKNPTLEADHDKWKRKYQQRHAQLMTARAEAGVKGEFLDAVKLSEMAAWHASFIAENMTSYSTCRAVQALVHTFFVEQEGDVEGILPFDVYDRVFDAMAFHAKITKAMQHAIHMWKVACPRSTGASGPSNSRSRSPPHSTKTIRLVSTSNSKK